MSAGAQANPVLGFDAALAHTFVSASFARVFDDKLFDNLPSKSLITLKKSAKYLF
jgi:hypothetical protein